MKSLKCRFAGCIAVIVIFLNGMCAGSLPADLNGDGIVDFYDLAEFASQWLDIDSSPAPVSDPGKIISEQWKHSPSVWFLYQPTGKDDWFRWRITTRSFIAYGADDTYPCINGIERGTCYSGLQLKYNQSSANSGFNIAEISCAMPIVRTNNESDYRDFTVPTGSTHARAWFAGHSSRKTAAIEARNGSAVLGYFEFDTSTVDSACVSPWFVLPGGANTLRVRKAAGPYGWIYFEGVDFINVNNALNPATAGSMLFDGANGTSKTVLIEGSSTELAVYWNDAGGSYDDSRCFGGVSHAGIGLNAALAPSGSVVWKTQQGPNAPAVWNPAPGDKVTADFLVLALTDLVVHRDSLFPLTIDNAVFTGTGPNDMLAQLSSQNSYNGPAANRYVIQIDSLGSPNTFKWYNDGGVVPVRTNVAITGNDQLLENRIEVKFSNKTGHNIGDRWSFTAGSSPRGLMDGKLVFNSSSCIIEHAATLNAGMLAAAGVSNMDVFDAYTLQCRMPVDVSKVLFYGDTRPRDIIPPGPVCPFKTTGMRVWGGSNDVVYNIETSAIDTYNDYLRGVSSAYYPRVWAGTDTIKSYINSYCDHLNPYTLATGQTVGTWFKIRLSDNEIDSF